MATTALPFTFIMKEAITIKNFGPVKEVEINDIRPFTVFIGESGSGKSTVMKVAALFRWIHKMLNIRSYLKYAGISQSPFSFDFPLYVKNSGLSEYIKPDTDIFYQKGETKIHYGKKLGISPLVREDELSLEKMSFISDKRNVIPEILAGNAAVEGFFLKETCNDFMLASKHVDKLNMEYLGVSYFSEKTSNGTKYFIKGISDDRRHAPIKLENASSGVQNVAPLSAIVEYFAKHYDFSSQFNKMVFNFMAQSDSLKDFKADLNVGEIRRKNVHIHVEEPELSLYPESQRSLINFIVNRCFVQRHSDFGMTVMMATHSPYIVNHLNLLIKAFDKSKTVEGAALGYDDVAVYQITDGKLFDLKIRNERLINTNPLSDAINDIYDEYNEL
jgi:predicted ATPase